MSEKPTTDLELMVPRGGKVVGRVLDPNNKPIVGAFVGRGGSILSMSALWVVADAEGNFVYDGFPLQEKDSYLNASATGYIESQEENVLVAPEGPPVELEFQLQVDPTKAKTDTMREAGKAVVDAGERRTIRGTILGPDEKPVPNALVRWGLAQLSNSIESKTDSAGNFELAFVPNTAGKMSVIPESDELAAATISIEALGEVQLDWTIGKGHSVKGVVQDIKGHPFEDVMVLPVIAEGFGANIDRLGLSLRSRAVRTDPKGRFEVKGLPKTDVTFTFLGSSVKDVRDQTLDFDKENIVITKSMGAIRGKVVDRTGKPIRNFRIQLYAHLQRMPNGKGGYFVALRDPGLTYTSDDGSFIIRGLVSETVVRLTALAPGHEPGDVDRVLIKAANEQTPDDVVTIKLR